MIELTRLNGHSLFVNPDLIKFIEEAPDTVLTLTSGEKVVVREGPQQVLESIIRFRSRLAAGLETAIAEEQNRTHIDDASTSEK